jgi:hypothetical protein
MHQVERVFAKLPPNPEVVRTAFAKFREGGELPENVRVARAVIDWAETGIDPTKYGDDFESKARRLRAYVESARAGDAVMNRLREEAVFAEDPVRHVARILLRQMANGGQDVAQPLFQQGVFPTPEMTCASVALSMIRWPFCVVDEVHHERLASVIAVFRHNGANKEGEQAWTAWVEQVADAAIAFQTTGRLPEDPVVRDTVLAEAELSALFQTTCGVDDEEMRKALARCDELDEGLRAEALALRGDSLRPTTET